MRSCGSGWRIAMIGAAFASTAAFGAEGEEVSPTISFGGFIRADYGAGERYPRSSGEDQVGISKAALAATAQHEGIKGVLVIGTEHFIRGGGSSDARVGVKDAFIVIGSEKERGFSFSAGAQPVLFGLKPNGYPGDRSLQPSIEFGGTGAFAVSNQAGPSLIGTYKLNPSVSVRFGAFDPDEDNATLTEAANDGSRLTDNLFVQLRAADIFNTGLYATVGAESLYVGGAVNESKAISAAGLGFAKGMFDVSVELTQMDRNITGTSGNEQYVVTEFSVAPNSQWLIYTDWSDAKELDSNTLRVGAHHKYTRYLTFSAEYSKDQFGAAGVSDSDSVDLRVTISY